MFSTNEPQAAAGLTDIRKENAHTEAQRRQSDGGRGKKLNAPGHTLEEKSRLSLKKVDTPNEVHADVLLKQNRGDGAEKLDDALPRLAPVKIPSLGAKWEYYSGAPLPQEPQSPDSERDSGESAQGPTLGKNAGKPSVMRAKSIASSISTGSNFSRSSQGGIKRKRSLPGTPDPNAEVIALSPRTLLATNRFVCEICNKGFQRDQNLQLHRRGHNVPWKLRARPPSNSSGKRVYVCPEPTCVHHDPRRALGDLTGIKKHYSRKHGEKRWKCDKCGKKYAVEADWKAHTKTCGPKQYTCDCGSVFTRRETFATHRACCKHVSDRLQPPGHPQLSAFGSGPSTHSFSNFQLPPSSFSNFGHRPILPRRLPPPAPVFTARSTPATVAHIGQSHDGTPLLISVPARVSGSGQPGLMADINLAARRGLNREPLQLLPLSGPMWGQRSLGTPPPAASAPLPPALNLWLGSRPPATAVHQSQPLQPLAIPGRVGGVKLEIGANGNGLGEMGQSSEGATSPLSLRYAETFSQGQQTMLVAPQTAGRAASPLLQPLPVSPRPEQQGGDGGSGLVSVLGGDPQAALPSAAAAAAAVAAANAGHQVTIEVNPAPGESLPTDHSPREQVAPPEGGAYTVLEQPPVVHPGAPLMGTSPGAPVVQMSAVALHGGEVAGMGMMEQQSQGGQLLVAAAQVGGGDQAMLLDAQRPGGEGSPMLVGGGQVVETNQEDVLWAKMHVDEQQKAQQAAQQAQAQAQAQQSMQHQMAVQQAQQQGLQMAIHQAGIQLAAAQQAQQQGLQMGGQVDLQQSLHISLDAPPSQVAVPGGVPVGLPPPSQQMVATQQEMLTHAQEAEQQLAAQQGLLNLQAVSQQMGLSAVPPLQRLSPGLPSMAALHPPPGAELLPGLQQPATSPRSLLAALPSGSANTTAQGGAADEGKKADMMQEAISAAARGSTQKLNELIEQEAQKQQHALALAQATEQHQHGGTAPVLAPPSVVLVEGGSPNVLPEGFVDPQAFGTPSAGQFFATVTPQTGLTGLGSVPQGGMAAQVVGSSILGGSMGGGQLDMNRANLSPREGEQLLRSLSRQHLSELAAAGMGGVLDVGGALNSVGNQLTMLQSVEEGAMHAERGRQEALATEQLHSHQSVASMVASQRTQADLQQHSHVMGGLYREQDSLTQASLVGDSLGRDNEHPPS